MRDKAFALPPVVRSVILEQTEKLLPKHRDTTSGEIRDKDLVLAVIRALDKSHAEIASIGKREAWAVAVYQTIRWYIRHSTANYAVHHREHREAVGRVRARQRRMVTFRDHTGKMVTKDRRFLRKDELSLVRVAYERIGAGAQAVVEWCDAVYEQMTLRGLADDALVAEVIDEAEEDAA